MTAAAPSHCHRQYAGNTLNEIYFGKTKNIVNDLRSVRSLGDEAKKQADARAIADAMATLRRPKK